MSSDSSPSINPVLKEVGVPRRPGDPGTQDPEWELPPVDEKRRSRLSILPVAAVSSQTIKRSWGERLKGPDAWKRSIAGWSRRRRIAVASAVALILLVLLVAIPVGVTQGRKSHGSQNLPLPNNAERHTGDLTYYGTGLGACGVTSKDTENIVAVSHSLFDAAQTGSDPNANPLCGLKIRATRYYAEVGSERSVDLTVVDRCVGCKPTDLDVSITAFEKLAPEAAGRVDVTWAWLQPAATGI